MERLISNTAEMGRFAQDMADRIQHKPGNTAWVIGLHGELGAGKTTFSQYFAKALGAIETITSPTFVIMKQYPISGGTYRRLVHIDAYRLTKGEDLEVLGIRELIADPRTIILIEWPENVYDILPTTTITIRFSHVDEHTRRVQF